MEAGNQFYLEVSDSLELLAEQLAKEIKMQHYPVFQPIYIVTQTDGMNSWLKLKLAGSLGIAANFQFLKPNDVINKLYFLLDGRYHNSLNANELNWLIYKMLGEKDFIMQFKNVSAYYIDNGADNEIKRMGLAEKISDLFDQYQVYRPEMIAAWNEGKTITEFEDEQWQQFIWMRTRTLAGEQFPDKTTIGKFILEQLPAKEMAERLQKKMPVIYLFGISVITEYHLNIFQNVSNYIPIYFLLLNPSPIDYWYEDKSEKLLLFLKKIGKAEKDETATGNSLLTAWGKIIRDTFSILFKNDSLVNSYDLIGTKDSKNDTLLHQIQTAIFQNKNPEKKSLTNLLLSDGSITINSCYGPAREVEVLYNYLVHLVDQRQERLSPSDIIVMVSDIDLYASYIKAIFGTVVHKFPYTIADETFAGTDNVSNALGKLLSLYEEDFTAEAVVSLLDFSAVKNKFKITDIAQIREVVDDANIRFGIHGSLADDSLYVSWKYGLQRIMFGLCIFGGEEFGGGEESFFPLDNTESSSSYNVIRFVHFVSTLIESVEERRRARDIEGWVKYVEYVLSNFLGDKETNENEEYNSITEQLAGYNEINQLFAEDISYKVFMHSFLPQLSSATRSKDFARGGITFCSLIPMRSIPFKVVALLGMNFDNFPRNERKTAFNLIEKKKRKGDRNIKENDKHLFLETLLSAGDYFYMSFFGQSVKDNSTLPPSILIDELLDYIESFAEYPKKVRELLIVRQPLNGFSRKYLGADERLYSYLLTSNANQLNLKKIHEVEPFDFNEISLQKLISFLQNPIKGYYNNVLGINYDDNEITLSDTELFELSRLDLWKLKNEFLLADEDRIAGITNEKLKTGLLPLKNMGQLTSETIVDEITEVKELFQAEVLDEEAASVPIDLIVDGSHLSGEVNTVYGNKQIEISFSEKEFKYLLSAWIRHLALVAMGYNHKLCFISQIVGDVFKSKMISKIEAQEKIAGLIKLYKEGHKQIICFGPGMILNPERVDSLDANSFDSLLSKMFEGPKPTCNDIYMNKEYENGFFERECAMEEFKSAAQKLLMPLADFFENYPITKNNK
ncbi:MAG: exodeoxyribonuclease V subunit gamma [Bacteroidetes bacterium]|nr:exodeoxyribonuclease V subunit gamma [Bacteroidota bacterium]